MFYLSRYKKNGLLFDLIKERDALIEKTVSYFEKGRNARRGIKDARRAIRGGLKLARKKKVNPGLKIEKVRAVLEDIREQVEYTRRVLRATALDMENTLSRIEQERINDPLMLIENAREAFREKEFDKGIEALRKSKDTIEKKILEKTRTALFGGLAHEIKELKSEIEELQN
jgi:hypothetical protein